MATVKTKTSNYKIYEVISKGNKTSLVKEITNVNPKNEKIKNELLVEDVFIPLNTETAKIATLIISIKNPEWGVKAFQYNGQYLGAGNGYCHTWGVGSNSSIMGYDEMRFWRVIA
jgi:hypothetical protein